MRAFAEARVESTTDGFPWGWLLVTLTGIVLSLLWWWLFRRPER